MKIYFSVHGNVFVKTIDKVKIFRFHLFGQKDPVLEFPVKSL